MGCMLAVVFGLVGAVLASIVRANIPGQHHAGMDFLLFICSGVFTIPLGYFIGEAIEKVQRNKEELAQKPVKQFPRQITGSKCDVCGQTILMANDGRRCDQCQNVLHHECSDKHVCPPSDAKRRSFCRPGTPRA